MSLESACLSYKSLMSMKARRRDTEKNTATALPSLQSPALCQAASSQRSAAASVNCPPSPAEPEGEGETLSVRICQAGKRTQHLCGKT